MFNTKTITKFGALALSVALLAGCNESTSDTRDIGKKEQENIMQRAVDSEPTYQPTNFLTRKYVNEYMRRMDDVNKVFYIYVLGKNGNMIGYYVGTRPVNVCTLLTPPDQLHHANSTNGRAMAVTKAPQLDGVYSNGGCNVEFFFDNATDALIEIKDLSYFIADKPLDVDAEPITVSTD